MRVLGIDPGLRLTGFACLEYDPARPSLVPTLLDAGAIRLRESASVASRLVELERDLRDIVESLRPDTAYIEKLYAHYEHPTTAITMGHARGVILLVLKRAGIEPGELPSTEVKKSVAGNGHASKAQVARAAASVLGLPGVPEPADVSDAIAIALTGIRREPPQAMRTPPPST